MILKGVTKGFGDNIKKKKKMEEWGVVPVPPSQNRLRTSLFTPRNFANSVKNEE